MARVIRTLCDPHSEDGEHPAETYRFELYKQVGGKWEPICKEPVVDLCDEAYVEMMAAVVELLQRWGRLDHTEQPGEKSAGKRHYCLVPGCGAHYKNEGTLTDHMRKKHGGTPRVNGQANGHAPASPKAGQRVIPDRVKEIVVQAGQPLTAADVTEALGLQRANSSQVRIVLQREGALGRKLQAKTTYARPVVWAFDAETLAKPHQLEADQGVDMVPAATWEMAAAS